MKLLFMRRLIGLFFCAVLIISVSPDVWTDCEYCEELDAPPGIQLCRGTDSGSYCDLYYALAESACCSNTSGSDCNDAYSVGGCTYYWKETSGTCTGVYRCSDDSTPCNGDIIVASVNNCTVKEALVPETANCWECP